MQYTPPNVSKYIKSVTATVPAKPTVPSYEPNIPSYTQRASHAPLIAPTPEKKSVDKVKLIEETDRAVRRVNRDILTLLSRLRWLHFLEIARLSGRVDDATYTAQCNALVEDPSAVILELLRVLHINNYKELKECITGLDVQYEAVKYAMLKLEARLAALEADDPQRKDSSEYIQTNKKITVNFNVLQNALSISDSVYTVNSVVNIVDVLLRDLGVQRISAAWRGFKVLGLLRQDLVRQQANGVDLPCPASLKETYARAVSTITCNDWMLGLFDNTDYETILG